jgi:hypothetical protein
MLSIRQTKNDIVEVGNGWRLGGNQHINPDGRAIIVDDTVMTGNSLKAIASLVGKRFPNSMTAAIYVNPLAKRKPDLWVRDLGWPHLLEWNLFNSVLSPNLACDFDGILCHDCPIGADDDGERYLDFIRNAKPLYLPRKVPIPLIVTARIEKYRKPTMDWLDRHGVRVHNLVMHPAATLAERRKDDIAAYKAKHFAAWAMRHRAMPAPLAFIESEDWQARKIAALTDRMTICPGSGLVYRSGFSSGYSHSGEVIKQISDTPLYAAGSLDPYFKAVTALSELPHHLTRQTTCLDSWVRFGLSVIAVNTPDQIKRLRPLYPQVSQWIESNEVTSDYDRPTQKIVRLCRVATDIDMPVLMINSDIEIHGTHEQLLNRIGDNNCVVGIRFNYTGERVTAVREPYGLDAIVVTPEMAETLPAIGFGIGRPMWDTWIPYHFRKLGYTLEFIGEPLFYHEAHGVFWSQEDWELGARCVVEECGVTMDYIRYGMRQSLPYPP